MAVGFEQYGPELGFSRAFWDVWHFLLRIDAVGLSGESFIWAWWDVIFCRQGFDPKKRPVIDVWKDDGRVVGLVTNEEFPPGYAWTCLDPEYAYLRKDMLAHAELHLRDEHAIRVLIHDRDLEFQREAARAGYKATQDQEELAVLPIDAHDLSYTLPEGFHVECVEDVYDIRKYNRLMLRGFDDSGDMRETEEDLRNRERDWQAPHSDLKLNIVVVAPDGSYAAYCGMWHLPQSPYALIEPVATDPDYRRMGLGKAAVLEGIRRCADQGAKMAYVSANLQFYYQIGFHPWLSHHWWIKELGTKPEMDDG